MTLYGIADVSIRYVNTSDGATGADGSRLSMSNGAISNSRWACVARKTWATATAPSSAWSKASMSRTASPPIPARPSTASAYVGLDGGKIGALTMGLQTVIQDLMADYFDPLTVGNYAGELVAACCNGSRPRG